MSLIRSLFILYGVLTFLYLRNSKSHLLMECPICFLDKKLLVLDCGHSVCLPCYQKIISSKVCLSNCPFCRKTLIDIDYQEPSEIR